MSFLWQEILYKPLLNILVFLYNSLAFHDIGLAIIELTILVRLALLSPSLKALRAQIVLQKIQPELEKIRKKYKDDREKQTKATMEFYQKYKINPLSSCLPTLIQLPILIALFWILRDALGSSNLHLLYPFIHNPGKINPVSLGFFDLSQKGNWILALLAAASQFVQSKMIMPKPTKGQEGLQTALSSQMVYFMPLVTLIFALQFPAGLALYWLTTTVFAIGTQYFVLREEKTGKLNLNKNKQEGRLTQFFNKYRKEAERIKKDLERRNK